MSKQINIFLNEYSKKKKHQEFQGRKSRAMNQVQGPSKHGMFLNTGPWATALVAAHVARF